MPPQSIDLATAESWIARANQKLGEAADADSSCEAITATEEALLSFYLSVGENPGMVNLDTADYAEHVREESIEPPCTCPPELVARGGFKGSCPRHGTLSAG